MESAAIVREIDTMGRIVIPAEFRKALDINVKDPLELYVAKGFIVLRKYNSGYLLCGSMEEVERFNYMNVCDKCWEEMVWV